MTHEEFVAVLVAFIIGFLLILVLAVLWAGHDKRLDDHDGKFAVLEAAVNLGGEPQVLIDPATKPIAVPTEPMELDVAGGLRTTRPTPFVRQKGRHAAPAVSRGERG